MSFRFSTNPYCCHRLAKCAQCDESHCEQFNGAEAKKLVILYKRKPEFMRTFDVEWKLNLIVVQDTTRWNNKTAATYAEGAFK